MFSKDDITTKYRRKNSLIRMKYLEYVPVLFITNLSSLLLITLDGIFVGNYIGSVALAAVDMKQYDAAENFYKKAIVIMSKIQDGELDEAISYLNYADLLYAKYKSDVSEDYSKYSDRIEEFVSKAWTLLNTETIPHDEYYRFVCDKCAGSFGFYGFFLYEKELRKRAEV